MDERTKPVSETHVTLAMDYGQFCLDGGLGDPEDELELLHGAQSAQPSAGNGAMLLVLCPHQNNFQMPVTVQVWQSRPPGDRDQWQQVSEGNLEIDGHGVLFFSSPTMEPVEVTVPAGRYTVEVSGRGFVNYGWPGSTTPGDVWRIRLWPFDGVTKLPPQMWDMPGYGVPENIPVPESAPACEPSASSPAAAATTAVTGNAKPTGVDFQAHPELQGVLCLRDFDGCAPDIADAIAAMDPQSQRRLARWAAIRAFEFAGLADCDWVAPALDALRNSDPLPVPFDDRTCASRRLTEENLSPEGHGGPYRSSAAHGGEKSPAAKIFDHGPIHRPYFAMPALFSAVDPRPVVAAFQALSHACATYAEHVDSLLAAVRTEFGLSGQTPENSPVPTLPSR
ncbi:hypothetical protein [Rhodococcus sp. NPDC049939]|uniref:hypothetical protein n=1 Tax=Rhodococcus sp. NPDC049939 TaxID=3155511 RepID=UPI0033D27D5D